MRRLVMALWTLVKGCGYGLVFHIIIIGLVHVNSVLACVVALGILLFTGWAAFIHLLVGLNDLVVALIRLGEADEPLFDTQAKVPVAPRPVGQSKARARRSDVPGWRQVARDEWEARRHLWEAEVEAMWEDATVAQSMVELDDTPVTWRTWRPFG